MAIEDYYALLGVARGASANDVRKAYRQLVLRFHPDRNPNDPVAEEQFKRIATAYQILANEEKRTVYDERLRRMETPPSAASEVATPVSRPRPRAPREKNEDRPTPLISNELEPRDVGTGLIVGAFVAGLCGTEFLPELGDGGRFFEILGWSAIPAAGAFVGHEFFLTAYDAFDNLWSQGPVRQTIAKGLPVMGSVVTAGFAAVVAVKYGAPLNAGVVAVGSLAAGLAASLGGAVGRAFTSVGETKSAKSFGLGVAGVTGGISGGFLGAVLSVFGTTHYNAGFFDLLFTIVATGALGGGIASLRAALRPLSLLE